MASSSGAVELKHGGKSNGYGLLKSWVGAEDIKGFRVFWAGGRLNISTD